MAHRSGNANFGNLVCWTMHPRDCLKMGRNRSWNGVMEFGRGSPHGKSGCGRSRRRPTSLNSFLVLIVSSQVQRSDHTQLPSTTHSSGGIQGLQSVALVGPNEVLRNQPQQRPLSIGPAEGNDTSHVDSFLPASVMPLAASLPQFPLAAPFPAGDGAADCFELRTP